LDYLVRISLIAGIAAVSLKADVFPNSVKAAIPFSPGNLVIYRVGQRKRFALEHGKPGIPRRIHTGGYVGFNRFNSPPILSAPTDASLRAELRHRKAF
jgi:hypothetical protein